LLLQVNGMFRGYADVGSTEEFRENTGGSWIFVSPGLRLHLSASLQAWVYLTEEQHQPDGHVGHIQRVHDARAETYVTGAGA
jgi:hypothetical protein